MYPNTWINHHHSITPSIDPSASTPLLIVESGCQLSIYSWQKPHAYNPFKKFTSASVCRLFNSSPQRLVEASPRACKRWRSHQRFQSQTCCAQRCCIFQNPPCWRCGQWWCCTWVPSWWWTGSGQQSPCRSAARRPPGLDHRRWSKSGTKTEERVSQEHMKWWVVQKDHICKH